MRFLLVTLTLCATAQAASAAKFTDAEHGFSVDIPDGYGDAPKANDPRVIHGFVRGTLGEDGASMIQLQSLGGTIGRGPLIHETVEKAARASIEHSGIEISAFEYRTAKWKTFDVNVLVVRLHGGDKKLVSLATQIPLAKQAIQIYLMGPAGDEAKLESDFHSMLASLDGKSSWLSDDDRAKKLGELTVQALVVGLGIGFGIWALRRRRRAQKS
jgi:hypothetical protein